MTQEREPVSAVPLEYENAYQPRTRWWLIVLLIALGGAVVLLALALVAVRPITPPPPVQVVPVAGTPTRLPAPSRDQAATDGLPAEGVELTVVQRDERWLPGGEFLMSLGDITSGQVLVSVSDADGNVVAGPKSMRENGIIQLNAKAGPVDLTLLDLENHLTGDDFATFRLAPARPTPPAAPDSLP